MKSILHYSAVFSRLECLYPLSYLLIFVVSTVAGNYYRDKKIVVLLKIISSHVIP